MLIFMEGNVIDFSLYLWYTKQKEISERMIGMKYQTHECITKLETPVMTPHTTSAPGVALTFNAGVAKWKGRYVMMFRNDYGDYENEIIRPGVTDLRVAYSDDGIHWEPQPDPVMEELKNEDIIRAYDPRITVIEEKAYVCFAVDSQHGVRGGIAVTEDFEHFEVLSLSVPDNRNMVLFPEKINGNFVRLERPMPVDGRGWLTPGMDVWMSESPDLVFWGKSKLVLGTENVPFANSKIGPAAPPIKTEKGWLTLFHAVEVDPTLGKNGWEPKWQKIYSTGIMLLDLNDPSKVIGMYDKPLIYPENHWETKEGFRQNVLFPGGMVLEPNGEVKMYYGASDTFECLATANVNDLLALVTK